MRQMLYKLRQWEKNDMNTFEMVVLKHVVKDKYHDKQTEAENKIVWSFHSKSKKNQMNREQYAYKQHSVKLGS